MAEVGQIVGNALVAFWLGGATLLGAAMLIDRPACRSSTGSTPGSTGCSAP
jgi:hypothetical protein